MATVGIIYPGHAAEDDYPYLAESIAGDVDFPVVHIYGEDLHAIEQLMDLGSAERLAGGAELLGESQLDSVMWACTSGSFVFGMDGARAQVESLAKVSGIPASSTSFAFLHAVHALGAHRVAVAASYPSDVAERFVEFLSAGGLDVVSLSSGGIQTAAEVGELTEDQVVSLAVANDHPEAEVLLIPDTAMRTARFVPQLERALNKPVLTANQVTVWEGLRMTGEIPRCELVGALFMKSYGK